MKKELFFDFNFDELLKGMASMNVIFESVFGHTKYVNPLDLGILGQGIYLIDMNIPENKERSMKYGNLFKEDESGKEVTIDGKTLKLRRISKDIFRVGGMARGFKDNLYCDLIYYEHVSNVSKPNLGTHCIIDTEGKIVFKAESPISYPHYHKGVIVFCNNVYYNLKTGMPICESYQHTIASKDFLFVECSGYKKLYQAGVYKINYETGEFEIFE